MNEMEANELWMFDARVQNILRGQDIESVEDLREFIVAGFKQWHQNPLGNVDGIGPTATDQIICALAKWKPKEADNSGTADTQSLTPQVLNRVGFHVREARQILKKYEAKRARLEIIREHKQ